MNPWNSPGAYGLAIIPPHGRLPGAGSGSGSGDIPYMLADGRMAYEPAFGGTFVLGPQPEPPTLGQRVGQILQHPATGWAVAAALLGALLVRRGRAATVWGEPWRGAPRSSEPWSR